MEIKMKLSKTYIFNCFFIFTSVSLLAVNDDQLSINKLDNKETDIKLIGKGINSKDPLQGVVIDLTKIFDKTSTFKYSSNINSLNFNQIQDKEVLTLNDGDYIEIRGEDGIKRLFNGSILIQFNDFQNLQNFADLNDLILVNDFSDISVGVFKVANVLDLEIIINNLQKDSNILSIDLNTTKPVKPR